MRPSPLVQAFVKDLLEAWAIDEMAVAGEFCTSDAEEDEVRTGIKAREAAWRAILIEESRAEVDLLYAASRKARSNATTALDAYLAADVELSRRVRAMATGNEDWNDLP